MRFSCARARRMLSEHAVEGRPIRPGDALAGHIADCGGCSSAYSWYLETNRQLAETLPIGLDAPNIADAAWARLADRRTPSGFSIATTSFAAAIIAMVVAAGLLYRTSWIDSRPEVAGTKRPISRSHGLGVPSGVAAARLGKVPLAGVAVGTATRNAGLVHRQRRIASFRRERTPRNMKVVRNNSTRKLSSVKLAAQPVPWEKLASWYDFSGQYREAAAAYERAARERPADSLLFNAGRTSECAGNLPEAVEWYARVLSHDRDHGLHLKLDSLPTKGTWLWKYDRNSA